MSEIAMQEIIGDVEYGRNEWIFQERMENLAPVKQSLSITCDRCKQRVNEIVPAFDGYFCPDCCMDISRAWERCHHRCDAQPYRKQPIRWRFEWLWRFTKRCGVVLGLLPDKEYQKRLEETYFGSWTKTDHKYDPANERYLEAAAAAPSQCTPSREAVVTA